jgi:arsenate reductase-like glutaredoxin family protein
LLSELQDALTLSEQTINNLESELHIYEKQLTELNEKSKFSDEKVIQLINEKEKLVKYFLFHLIKNILCEKIYVLYFFFTER